MADASTVLIVDDNQELLADISETLQSFGFQTINAGSASAALRLLDTERIDLILAGIEMPGMNGYQFCLEVRDNPDWILIPFIFLTSRCMDSDIRYGKELGADDYLTKPVKPADLLASIRGRLRRSRQISQTAKLRFPANKPADELIIGRLRLDLGQYRAWLDEQPLQLSSSEFRILETLATNHGSVVNFETLVQASHNLNCDAQDASSLIRPMIRALRRKLGYGVGDLGCIENIRGVGYRLECD